MQLGQFSISLAVKDLAASRKFYETVGFKKIDGDDQRWLVLENGEAKIGLFEKTFEGHRLTFHPPDARALETAFREAGYPIEKPTEGTEGPAHFTLRDPDGNTLLVDQPETPPAMPVGKVGWVDLTVGGAEALKGFYSTVLGVSATAVDMGGYSDFALVDAKGAGAAGVCHARGPNEGLPPVWLVYFVVENLEASLARVEAQGGTVVRRPPAESGGHRYAVIRDPQGTFCALYQS